MRRQLPPLTGLRAFEATGRHLSITLAAAELAVTQAAVSHQVKALECHLGTPLFIRSSRKLELTDAGALLLPVAEAALDSISQTAARIRGLEETRPVELGVPPMFASCWLLPKLSQLVTDYPDLEVALRHLDGPIDFDASSLDIAVIYGGKNWGGLLSVPLLNIDYFPVCAPSLLTEFTRPANPAELCRQSLLHDTDHDIWQMWFKLVGVPDTDVSQGVVVEDTSVLIQAAIDGLGFAMCSQLFVQDYLADGQLIRPFDLALTVDKAYYAVCSRESLAAPHVKLVWDWLVANAEDAATASTGLRPLASAA